MAAFFIVLLILVVWGGFGIKEKQTPPKPPIKNMDYHLKKMMSLPDKKSRRAYIKKIR